jgi:hypothetical protein
MSHQNTRVVATQQRLEVISATDFAKTVFPKTHWIIDGLFENETINMISAAPNNYKSWLTIDIAVSLAKGMPLFGVYMVNEPQTVWIINEEDTKNGIQERMGIISKEWPTLPIYFSIQNQFILDDESVDELILSALARQVTFIIFDSLRSIHVAEENSATEMQKVMNQIKKITFAGITVLFTHHHRKKSMFRGSGAEDSRGSNAVNAAVHSHLTCEPKKFEGEEFLVIEQPKLKSAEKLKPFRLRINLKSNECGSFSFVGPVEESDTQNKTTKKILGKLEEMAGVGVNIKALITAGIGGERTLRNTLKEMVAIKSVVEKTWLEIQEQENLETVCDGGASNEKFYYLTETIKEV